MAKTGVAAQCVCGPIGVVMTLHNMCDVLDTQIYEPTWNAGKICLCCYDPRISERLPHPFLLLLSCQEGFTQSDRFTFGIGRRQGTTVSYAFCALKMG